MQPKFNQNKKNEILTLYPGYDGMVKKHLTLLSLSSMQENYLSLASVLRGWCSLFSYWVPEGCQLFSYSVHDCALYLGNKKDSLTMRCLFSKHIPVILNYIIVTSNWLLFQRGGTWTTSRRSLRSMTTRLP